MFRNILLISIIFVITLLLSCLIDLGGVIEMVFLDYKITSSVTFFVSFLIFLFFIFYLILRVNNLRMNLGHFIFDNPKRLEKKLNKKYKIFVNNVSKVLEEINNKNFSKAAKIEKNIKSEFYSEGLKSQILAQMNENKEIIDNYE